MEKQLIGISYRFIDTKELYEYGFNNYSIKTIVKQNDVLKQIEIKNSTNETKILDLYAKNDISILISNDINIETIEPTISILDNLTAPISEGDTIGTAEYLINDTIYSVDLIASHDVFKSKIYDYFLYILSAIILFTIFIYIFNITKNKN